MLRLKVLSFLLLIFFVSNASAIYASAQLPAFCNQTLSEIRQTCLAIDVKTQDKNTRGSFNIDASGLKLEAKGNSLSLFHRDKFISDMKYFDYGGCIRDLTDKIVNSALCGGDYGGAGSPPVTEDWLRYSSKGCMRQGAESVKCHFVVENLNPRTEDAVFLSEQKSGIRDTRMDKYGLTTAMDRRQRRYVAKEIHAANQRSPTNGQLTFKLEPELPLDVEVFFTNVDRDLDSFYRVTVPIYSDRGAVEINLKQVRIQR